MLTMTSGPRCRPRWSTPRRSDRATWATPARLAAVEELLRFRLMPWQRHVLEVALEVLDDGRLAYQTVGLSVGRQEGKSSLIDALLHLRATGRRRQQCVYTCQDRSLGRDRVLELAEGRAARYIAAVQRSNGTERITYVNRSRLAVVAGTAKAGRGRSLDLAVVDEAALLPFAVIDSLGPTQAARPDPQLWVTSNAGDETSLLFWHYTELGRDAAAMDPGRGLAWFEWGAGDDDDRADESTWHRAMPALDVTITRPFVRAKLVELERQPARFDREYLNRWPPGMGGGEGVDLAAWARAGRPRARAKGPRILAVDVAIDRSYASVCSAGTDGEGRVVVEVLERLPGTAWVPARVKHWRSVHRGAQVVADELVAASVVADLRAAHLPVDTMGGTEYARACMAFDDWLADGRVVHRVQAALDEAVAGAARRHFGDGWAWSRTRSRGDVAPFVGCVLAAWAHRTRRMAPAPQIVGV